MRRELGRYLLWQVPGWVVAGLAVFAIATVVGLPWWLAPLAAALAAAKDIALYPAMRVVFRAAGSPLPVGARGEVTQALTPVGYVRVHGELWRARVRGSDPVPPGSRVVIVGAHGLTLVVDPEPE
ncbi:MAG TPA: NfeD family protein [Candidatus Binatia bacterium]|nr:NfeD family protein [Candidatus Binatia bacterium]